MRSFPRCIAVVLMLAVATGSLAGCGIMQAGKQITQASFRQFSPKTSDYADPTNDGSDSADEWDFVGSEGRGDLPRDKESDGLTKWISSPKARSIERNLGVD